MAVLKAPPFHWSLLAVLAFTLAGPGSASAQTIAVQEEVAALLQDERDAFGFVSWAWRWARTLNTDIDVRGMVAPATPDTVMDHVTLQASLQGRVVYGAIDHDAFRRQGKGSISAVELDFSALPPRVTLSRLLAALLEQLPDKDATIVLKGVHFEITTVEAAGGRGLSFHAARRIAQTVRYWFLAGLACALLFLVLRAPTVGRRREGKLAGWLGLSLRAGLVLVFWPAWLVVMGLGLVRKAKAA